MHATWALAGVDIVHRNRRPRLGQVREEMVKMRPAHISDAATSIGDVAEAVINLWGETVASLGGLPPGAGHAVYAADWIDKKD